MACAFAASAMLQLNDPDPMAWIGIYILALGGCVGWHRRKIPAYLIRQSKIARVRKSDIDDWFRSGGNDSGKKGD